MRVIPLGACLLLVLAACDETNAPSTDPADGAPADGAAPSDAGPGPDAGPEPDAALPADAAPAGDAAPMPDAEPPPMVDPTEAVFALDHLIRVEVEMDPADWDTLRLQGRDGLDFSGADCQAEPWPSPWEWFPARVTVDGAVYDEVGIRKKGFFGSLSEDKPSVKVRFDKYVDGQNHETLTRLTLNNSRQDRTLLRTCLAYAEFARAGLPAPRCNFAHLQVNGQDLGVYAHVEALKRPFLARHFADPDGFLYEGTLSDFRTGFSGTIEQKTREDEPSRDAIEALTAALEVDDGALFDAVGAVVDLDRFFTFWALEALTGHWDGYSGNTNNFWFYVRPTDGLIEFIPWGPDGSFAPPYLFRENRLGPQSVFAVGQLARRLYLHPDGRARYIARLAELTETWDPQRFDFDIDTMIAVMQPGMGGQAQRAQARELPELRDFIANKVAAIQVELDRGGADWDIPERGTWCSVPVGIAEGTFQTTWGTWPTDNAFETGEGTFSGNLRGQAGDAIDTGAAAGIGDEGEGVLIVPAFFGDGTLVFVYVAMDPARIAPGEVFIDDEVFCGFNLIDRNTGDIFPLASCDTGVIVFDEVTQTPGDPVRGSFRLGLWGRP